MQPFVRPVLRGIIRPVVRVILGGGAGKPDPEVYGFAIGFNSKMWGMIESGYITGTDEQVCGYPTTIGI